MSLGEFLICVGPRLLLTVQPGQCPAANLIPASLVVLYISSRRPVAKSQEDFRTLPERVITSTEAQD